MNILALETATVHCSVALLSGDEIYSESAQGATIHSQVLLPIIDRLLQHAGLEPKQLDAIAFGAGPGSFTGLRIGIGVAQGLAFALDKPMIAVSSLQTLVASLPMQNRIYELPVVAAIDARMQEVYWGVYTTDRSNIIQQLCPPAVSKPDQVSLPETYKEYVAVGNGWQQYDKQLQQAIGQQPTALFAEQYPEAEQLVESAVHRYRSGDFILAKDARPDYVRNKVADKPAA